MKFDIKKIDKMLMGTERNAGRDVKQLAKTVIKTAVKRKIEEKIGEKVLWKILLYTAPFWLPFIAIFLLILLTLFVVLMASSGNQTTVEMEPMPTNIAPSSGIPRLFRQDAINAGNMFSVPLQYIAGETTVESGWDPNANANANNPNSNAMGLMQFEPQTWSGWSDPFTTNSSPDTDQTRIDQYRGYGIDANGYWAPVGTGATAAGEDAYLNQQCRLNQNADCAPYSSPIDPADALAGGANYLSKLYKNNADWASASASYYGGADATAYVQKVMTATDAYIADTSPIVRTVPGKNKTKTKEYFALGLAKFHEQYIKHRGLYITPISSRQYYLTQQFFSSMPLIMPTSGTVTWKVKNNVATITVPTQNKSKWTITVPSNYAMKWAIPRKTSKLANVPSGTILGFLNMSSGVKENMPLSSLYGLGLNRYQDFNPAAWGKIVYTPPTPPKVYVP